MNDRDDPRLLRNERVPELAYVWRSFSEMVHQARSTSVPTAANDALLHHVRTDGKSALAPALLLWIGDNFVLETRFAEAIEAYGRVVDQFPERRFSGSTWAALALERLADCHERLGQPENAIRALQRIIDSFPEGRSLAYLHFRTAEIIEASGKPEDAIRAYERASAARDSPSETQTPINPVARKAIDRLRSDRVWMRPTAEALARELALGLEGKKSDVLARLASPTHFSLGLLHGESVFVDRAALLQMLNEELQASNIRVDPFALEGTGDKRYLTTEGWQGSFLTDRVVVLLTHCAQGWEWSGIALTTFPPAAWETLLGAPRTVTNQALTLAIKAPWPSGFSFRAGGIIPFAAQIAICMGFGPFAPVCMQVLSASGCGFGPGGLFYGGVANFNFTHGGDDFFAIDFARFVPGLPFLNGTLGTPVLAVQTGMVSGVRSITPRGSTFIDNRVLVKHMIQSEFLLIVILEILSGTPLRASADPPFTSMYMHLDGPARIPVSPGMFVRQGAVLGPMDDTGNSVDHHLHFSVHDRSLPAAAPAGPMSPSGRSVRPTPMDGQRLLEIDDGTCVGSSNI